MKSEAYILFIAFWICCPLHLAGQADKFVSRHYTMKDGLPTDGVNCVIQDRLGFIWLGTFSGVTRFDGHNFSTYRNNTASANTLRNNYVRTMIEDTLGRIWIGHAQGVDVFDPRTEEFIFHWPDSTPSSHAFPTFRIRKRKDGKFWICGPGLYVADPTMLKIEKFSELIRSDSIFKAYDVADPATLMFEKFSQSIRSDSILTVRDVAETRDGRVLLASGNHGVIDVNSLTTDVVRFKGEPGKPENIGPSSECLSVFIDKRDRIWIGTEEGIYQFIPQAKKFIHYPIGRRIGSIEDDHQGRLWLGGRNGLFLFDPATGKAVKMGDGPNIFSILRDKQGNTWTATLQGLRQLNVKNKTFNTYKQFGQIIGSIAEDAQQNIWIIGADQSTGISGLFRVQPSDIRLPQLHPVNLSYSDRQGEPRSLLGANDGKVWLASLYKLEQCDVNANVFPVVNLTKRLYVRPAASLMDSKGNVWIGDWGSVNRFDPKTGEGQNILFPNATVYSFMEDKFQNLWIGSTAGLGRYNLRTGKLDVFNNQPGSLESLANNMVYHIMRDLDENIWIGTGGGLHKMIKGTENDIPKFMTWRSGKSGLPQDDVYFIVDGGDGTLWITCGNAISHFFPDKNVFRNYDQNDGLSGASFRGFGYLNGKGLRTRDGYILFGSAGGLVVFHPDSLIDNSFVPPVIITGLQIHNKSVPVKGPTAHTSSASPSLSENIAYTRHIVLTSDQSDFSFEFAALNFTNPEKNKYKYKLEPYETDWIETASNNRVARYTNINPGHYTFRVIGSNDDGVWNEAGATVLITILPPWWQTWWAYSLYGLMLIGIILYWRSYEINRLKHKHRAEYLGELDSLKTRFFANISHEFRTPITLILGPLKKYYNKTSSKHEKEEMGTMVRNGQRLLGLINQLLDLSKIEAGKMKLHASPIELVEFLREISSAYESLATDKKIKYLFYTEEQLLITYIDHEKIEKVIHNLLSNAFKFTKAGEIILTLKVEKANCLITVKDTGIGIPSDQLDKVFDRFYQVDSSQTRGYEGSGLGMALAKELVELHRGKISVQSNEGKGTTFTVMLPLGKEHLNKEETGDLVYTREAEVLSDLVVPAGNGEGQDELIASKDHAVVLIVEDNADMRNYIRKTLSDRYQILEAENGQTGLAAAIESVPDLIISDIMMPVMDGYKLCELIKTNEVTSHIPVILLTAKADRESKLTGLETGADDYLSKPFDADELKLIVRNRIEERRKMREQFSKEITLEPKQISINSLDEKFLTKVLAIIEEHMDDENFSIEELSREAGFSNMHFYRKIKALSGQTPSQFLRTIRLKRAAELLAKNSDNVTQIAYGVGFSSLSYFNKCFKEQFGVTPGQFAKESFTQKIPSDKSKA